MSWSLQVTHGDLAFGPQGLNTVAGESKLVQDLTCAVLEPMGTDPLHPTFGSTLDGGIDPQGRPHPSVIGMPNDSFTSTLIGAEIQRVCRAYQGQQIARNQGDVAIYGKSTLTDSEALLTVDGIKMQAVLDHVLVTALLRTGAGNVQLALPFST